MVSMIDPVNLNDKWNQCPLDRWGVVEWIEHLRMLKVRGSNPGHSISKNTTSLPETKVCGPHTVWSLSCIGGDTGFRPSKKRKQHLIFLSLGEGICGISEVTLLKQCMWFIQAACHGITWKPLVHASANDWLKFISPNAIYLSPLPSSTPITLQTSLTNRSASVA